MSRMLQLEVVVLTIIFKFVCISCVTMSSITSLHQVLLPRGDHVWLLLDGPVDAICIENLNSVLDDNKTLTLANGDRIPMSTTCKIVFEPHNIDNASPSTVSRNGIVFMSSSGLDWKPILKGWLLKDELRSSAADLLVLFEKFFDDLCEFVTASLTPKMDVLECNYIKQSVLLIGEQGTAKTVMIKGYLSTADPEEHVCKNLSFSSATTPMMFQRTVESCIDKRSMGLFGPPGGKRMTIFIDDLNMPEINEWGDQDGTWELDQRFELNSYVDIILKDILENAGDRYIILSCFHPDICTIYQSNTTKEVLDTILSIQPKDTGGSAGETREAVVYRLAKEMMLKLPKDYSAHEVKDRIKAMGELQPLNIFLKQEIDRMQRVITNVRSTLSDLELAIDGAIVMNEILRDALDSIFDARVPATWQRISWDSSSIGFWFSELLDRNNQLFMWLFKGRPDVFWMTGFFNPQDDDDDDDDDELNVDEDGEDVGLAYLEKDDIDEESEGDDYNPDGVDDDDDDIDDDEDTPKGQKRKLDESQD